MKWQILIIIILLLPIVMADQGEIEVYKPREVLDLSVLLLDKTGVVTGADCIVDIKNESYTTIHSVTMNEIGDGWYNATYNQSKTGKYFCTQNCTKTTEFIASTCDFVIQGDKEMPIAIILTVIFIIVLYFIVLINLFTSRTFTEHGVLKLLFLMTAFWILLIPLNIAVQFNDFNGGPVAVTNHLNLIFRIMIWLNVIITFYWFLWFIIQLLKKLMAAKAEGRLKL